VSVCRWDQTKQLGGRV